MNQAQGRGMSMVFVLVVSAILCAVATFVAVSLVSRRSQPFEQGQAPSLQQVQVEGMLITLRTDPNKAVYMLGGATPDEGQPESPSPTQPIQPTLPPPTPAPPTPAPESVIFIDYVVQPTDSLYSIAAAQNSSIELMALHGIDGEDMISGLTIRLPIANPAYCPGNIAYVVRDHDTVYGVSTTFSTTPQAIRDLNGLDENYTVKTTEVICIPA
jgi:LysM repeat protein